MVGSGPAVEWFAAALGTLFTAVSSLDCPGDAIRAGTAGTPWASSAYASGWFGVGTDFQTSHHAVHQRLPVGEEQVSGQGAQIIEESLAGRQGGADEPIVRIGKGQEGVIEEG